MPVPTKPVSLMFQSYKKVFPAVHQELKYWQIRAYEIPNEELRKQALASIGSKTFHCEGGAIMSLLAGEKYKEAIHFIVAYQTISDYLDNLCDRSTSQDPKDFSALHEAMADAITVGKKPGNYYRFREDQDDGGYLHELVSTCQNVLMKLPHYDKIKGELQDLCQYYSDLQIHKHVEEKERIVRLKNWFQKNKQDVPAMEWYEFSACTGSTLGIFCLVSYAFREYFQTKDVLSIRRGYFPYMQGFHILLDYLIDQKEDREGGDLNFCFYYKDNQTLAERLIMFMEKAEDEIKNLPDRKFHQLINRGLLGIYLSDEKVKEQDNVLFVAKKLLKAGGIISQFFYWNGKLYRKWLKLSFADQ